MAAFILQQLLNKVITSSHTTLGTLENLYLDKYDLILANPPYYQSAAISEASKSVKIYGTETKAYTSGGRGIEALFTEWIVKSIKKGGIANIILPDGIFTNIGNNKLKQLIIENCYIDSIISLPVGTFFNTPKKTFILTIHKRTELIDVLIEEEKQWSELPEVSNIAIWKCEAERYAQYDYDQIWNECVLETIDYLKIAKEALNQGILDLGHDTLQKLGCYNSRINGAGNVSAVISIYLFSKYADDPVMAVYETANLNNADTDTLASMVGGLVGALNGKDWIPIELRGVQDYSLFEYLIEQMMDEKCDFLNSDKQYQLFNNEKMATLEIGDSIECLPFGEITLKEIREDKPKRAGMYVKVYVWKTAYGQTIFSKKIGKKTLNMEQTIPHTVEKKHSPEIQFTVQKLKDIKKLLIKVSDAADFVEILSEIVQMKIDDDISKEKIDEMKVKWKPYKITKKQIVSIYELL